MPRRLLDRAYLALFREYPQLGPLALVAGASQLAFALLNVYALPIYLVHGLGLSGLTLGMTSATFLAVEMLLKFPLGRLSDRYGRKLFMVLGPLLVSLNPTLIAFLLKRLWMVVFPLRALDGIGAAALWPPLFVSVGDLTSERRRAAAMSAYPFPLVLLISLLMTLGVLTLASFLVLYLYEDLRLTRLQSGLLMVSLGLPILVLGLPLGHAADRWGKALAVRLSLTLSAGLMWLVPSCHSLPLFGIIAAALVLSHVLGAPAWLALVSSLAPARRRGGMMGAVATADGLGAVLGPLVGGWLWDLHHAYIFYGAAAFLSLAAVIALVTLRREAGESAGRRGGEAKNERR